MCFCQTLIYHVSKVFVYKWYVKFFCHSATQAFGHLYHPISKKMLVFHICDVLVCPMLYGSISQLYYLSIIYSFHGCVILLPEHQLTRLGILAILSVTGWHSLGWNLLMQSLASIHTHCCPSLLLGYVYTLTLLCYDRQSQHVREGFNKNIFLWFFSNIV